MREVGLIISVDFELDWGYSNLKEPLSEDEISKTLDGLITVLNKHKVKSTWAIVGQLFNNIEEGDLDDSKRRLKWITNKLINNDLVEIGSHTYNHIFCEEVSIDVFKKDIFKMNIIAENHNKVFKSIVFPRNQYNRANIDILKQAKYTHFRSVLSRWFLKTNKYSNESFLKRFCIRFSELLPFNRDVMVSKTQGLIAISDSRFFRFFSNSYGGRILSAFYLKILEIEMKNCFKREHYYHIWFHPHNLMKKPNAIKDLDYFLSCYKKLEANNKRVKSFKFTEINLK